MQFRLVRYHTGLNTRLELAFCVPMKEQVEVFTREGRKMVSAKLVDCSSKVVDVPLLEKSAAARQSCLDDQREVQQIVLAKYPQMRQVLRLSESSAYVCGALRPPPPFL